VVDKHREIIETIKMPTYDVVGKLIGVVGIAPDLTERKHAETELASQIDELRRRQDVTLEREMRALELKREVNELCRKLGLPLSYTSIEEDDERDD
jgi:hypothetical protein